MTLSSLLRLLPHRESLRRRRTVKDPLTRWQRKRLNAPVGYRWDDEDVWFEKSQGWLSGFGWGVIASWVLNVVIEVLL